MRATVAMLTASLTLFASSAFPLHAEDAVRRFVIPSDDGYGMSDCLAEGGTCAKLVADSWCQSNGMKSSLQLETADPTDITASLTSTVKPRTPSPAYIVSCKG